MSNFHDAGPSPGDRESRRWVMPVTQCICAVRAVCAESAAVVRSDRTRSAGKSRSQHDEAQSLYRVGSGLRA